MQIPAKVEVVKAEKPKSKKPKSVPVVVVETKKNESDALKLIRELKEELQPMTTKEFIANSRQSRRRLAF